MKGKRKMKKSLAIGAASLVMAAMPVFGAFAESPQMGNSLTGYMTGTHDVTVGEVDETVYSVDISWGDMTFDWKYDTETNEYGFKARLGCEGYVMSNDDFYLASAKEGNKLFSDELCSVLQTDELVDGETYYVNSEVGGKILVSDFSVNGRVKADVSFSAGEGYGWVVGKFSEGYDFDLDTGHIEYDEDLAGGSLHMSQQGVGGCWLHFEKANDYMLSGDVSVSASDKIGTVIVAISPDYN